MPALSKALNSSPRRGRWGAAGGLPGLRPKKYHFFYILFFGLIFKTYSQLQILLILKRKSLKCCNCGNITCTMSTNCTIIALWLSRQFKQKGKQHDHLPTQQISIKRDRHLVCNVHTRHVWQCRTWSLSTHPLCNEEKPNWKADVLCIRLGRCQSSQF